MKRVKKKKKNKEEIIILTEKDNKVFFNVILNPPSPNEDLFCYVAWTKDRAELGLQRSSVGG